MADPVVEEVLELISTDDHLPRLVAVLGQLNEKQRKSLSGPVGKRADSAWLGTKQGRNAAALAVLGCVTGVRQAASRLEWLALDEDVEPLAVEVLTARRPHWLAVLPDALLVGRDRRPTFRLVRALVRAGLVDSPEFPEYALSMVRGLTSDWFEGASVRDQLLADPGLRHDEVWRLFRTEGAGKELTLHDSFFMKPFTQMGTTVPPRPERTWQQALVALAAEGEIDRARLIDETLGAFFRDWTAGDVAWFAKLHDALQPTTGELTDRQQTYGRLLAVEPGAAVNLGLRAIGSILDAGRLDVAVLLTNAPAVLVRREKGSVVDALKLLDRVARTHSDMAERIAEVAGPAVGHEHADVRERVTTLLAKLVPDPAFRQAIVHTHAGLPDLAPAASPVPARRPPPPAALDPVSDANELAELLAHLVEEADDPAEIERLLHGVARFARNRPDHGTPALVKRLDDLAVALYPGPWLGEELRADLVQLGLVWLDRRRPGKAYPGREYGIRFQRGASFTHAISLRRPDWSLGTLVTLRIHEVAAAVAAGGASLLAFPTHRDGSLDAGVLTERIVALGRFEKPLKLDAGLAALRIAPEQYGSLRGPAGHAAAKRVTEQVELLRGHRPAWELVIGDSPGRFEHEVCHGAVTWRDSAAPRGALDKFVNAVLDRRDPLDNLALELSDGEYSPRYEQITGMWPLILPHHVDLLAAHAHARLNRGLNKNRAATEPLLAAVGAARRPVGAPAASALVLGLAAKNGVERARAVDAIVDLSASGLLAGDLLGEQLGALLRAGAVVGSRITPGLAEAARADGAAASTVLECLVAVLGVLPGRRDAHQFVDLLAQLAIQHRRTVELPASFAELARSKQDSVLAKACRRVPSEPA